MVCAFYPWLECSLDNGHAQEVNLKAEREELDTVNRSDPCCLMNNHLSEMLLCVEFPDCVYMLLMHLCLTSVGSQTNPLVFASHDIPYDVKSE